MKKREKIYEFSLIISLESLINQSVWGWGGVLFVTMSVFSYFVWVNLINVLEVNL